MQIDLGNALASEASPGISRDRLDMLDTDVASAHDRIAAGRADDDFGYAALNLPSTTNPDDIRAIAETFDDVSSVLTVGIGGSALGAATVTDALPGAIPHYVLDNVDPAATQSVLDEINLNDVVVHVVSRSGTTAETLVTFRVIREAMRAAGIDWTDRTVITTGPDGPLRDLAADKAVPTFGVPAGVPGRYSVLSPVGLFAPAVAGIDIDAILAGARQEATTLTGSLFDCPAYAYGAICVALARRGAAVNVLMPYAEALERFTEWFAQLWAESLGKEGQGQLPARAVGVTDQHSQLQRYRAGPRNVLVTFLQVRSRPQVGNRLADEEADVESIGPTYLEDVSLSELIDIELKATEASLAQAGRPNVRFELDRIDPANLGRLFYALEAACIMAAELQGTNAFDQPAVEWGKQATWDLLAGRETETTTAIEEKSRLIV